MKPLALFAGIVVVGLLAIEVGLRATDHPAHATPLPMALSHAQFVREGNAVCARYYREAKTIFRSKPKSLKMVTRKLRLWMPLVERDVAGLRALVPPARVDGTYRRLLSVMGQEDYDAHAVLHAFETGQYRRGVLIARRMDHLDKHFNSLARRLDLSVCGEAGPHASSGSPRKSGRTTVKHSRSVGKSTAAAASRFVGSYQTSVRVLVDTGNPPLPVGFTRVRTWRFVQECSGCAITLFRPSDLPTSTVVMRYSLHRLTGNRYGGKLAVPGVCYSTGTPPSKVLPPGSIVGYTVITLRPTRANAGRVVAYVGTLTVRDRPSGWGRREGCIATGYFRASLRSQG